MERQAGTRLGDDTRGWFGRGTSVHISMIGRGETGERAWIVSMRHKQGAIVTVFVRGLKI